MANSPGRPMTARPRILQAASELFLEHGLDVSLDAIACRACTSRPTLYSHFPGKDALLLETFAYLNDKMQTPLGNLLTEDQQALPQLLSILARVVQEHMFDPENIHFQRLLIQLQVQRPELYSALEKRPSGRVLQTLTETLARQRELGLIIIDDPQAQAAAFLGAIMGYPMPMALIEQKHIDEDWLNMLTCSAVKTFLCAWQYHPHVAAP